MSLEGLACPSIFASLGFDSVPLAQITKRADSRIAAVGARCATICSSSSHTVEVTVVWNTARS